MNVRKVNYKDENAPYEFTRSLRQTGFGVLTHHPIEKSLIDTVFGDWFDIIQSAHKNNILFNSERQAGYFP